MPTVTVDDQLGEARAALERIATEIQAKGDAAARARAELDQLGRKEPDARSARDTPAVTRWIQARQAAHRRLEIALGGGEDLDRRRREQERFVEQLEARRIPGIDDAIADARRQLDAIPAARRRAETDLAAAEGHRGRLEASAAVGDPIGAGEPARADQAIQDARGAIEVLGSERARLERLVDALLERRVTQAADLAAAARYDIERRWSELADESLAIANRLEDIGREFDVLDSEHRAACARYGLAPVPVRTVGEFRLDAVELERLVARVRGLHPYEEASAAR